MVVKSKMRRRIMAAVGAVVLISLLSSTFSLFRITELNLAFSSISHVISPLERLAVQMQSDSDLLKREMERGLGYSNWKDPHWKPRALPPWLTDALDRQIDRAHDLVTLPPEWNAKYQLADEQAKWTHWSEQVKQGWLSLKSEAENLHHSLMTDNRENAQRIYPAWVLALDVWQQELDWGARESEKLLRNKFVQVQESVTDLKTSLQIVLTVVVFLSLCLLWLGERALRPLAELTRLARSIRERGLRQDDKFHFPEIPLSRQDEVSQLGREFRQMATSLLEREKTVESQKSRLEGQNRLLREFGELNKNILNSIEAVLIVADLDGKVTQCNPVALQWLGKPEDEVKGQPLLSLPHLRSWLGDEWSSWVARITEKGEWIRLEPQAVDHSTFGGNLMPLRHESGEITGCILVFSDLTDQLELEKRLRLAENLAAVGRMSAQVAHEVRNPLHSIGLETEIALEEISKAPGPKNASNASVRQSLQSIQASVERLERITENYLKLSRLSSGNREAFAADAVMEEVLAIYAPACEAAGIRVEWSREKGASFRLLGDRHLFEQALGNLFRNAIQAVESSGSAAAKRIEWKLGNTETGRAWIRIEDSGAGVPDEVRARLFAPFLTTKAQGTGLGLSFVKQVIDNHGGEIRLVSEPGEGACFELVLPLHMELRHPGPEVSL